MCVRCLPGESCYQMVQRVCREADERLKLHVAEIEKRRAAGFKFIPCNIDLPLSVGTFDCNGNMKGSGWTY